jgi:rhamnogalacturonyl hydrolase YesR
MQTLSIALAETILSRYPNPDDIPYKVWCYVQGYWLAGFEMLWKYTGDSKYFDYIRKFVDQHVTDDGYIPGVKFDNVDDIMAGTMIVAMYETTSEHKYRIAADKIRAAFDVYPRNSDGGFWHSAKLPHEIWIDGVFMGGMFLTRYGSVIGDQAYCFDEITHQILTFAGRCRKGDTGLYLHAYDESRGVAWADPATGLSSDVWSEGLGWYALILVETLKVLPPEHPNRGAVMHVWLDLAEGLKKVQDSQTGLWYQVVDKGDQADNWQDTSGSAMFVYAIQRAIDLGYVETEKYGPVVERGYKGLVSKAVVNEDGLLDIYDACDGVCVQRSYEDYVNYTKTVNAKEAVGGLLWAATIVEKPGLG